jgi:hypothetical protein
MGGGQVTKEQGTFHGPRGKIPPGPTKSVLFKALPFARAPKVCRSDRRAGEKFCLWIKISKKKPVKRCLKKSIDHETRAKSGENHNAQGKFFGWHRRC